MSTTVLTVRLNARLKKQIRARAKGQHRPLSEQVRRYRHDGRGESGSAIPVYRGCPGEQGGGRCGDAGAT